MAVDIGIRSSLTDQDSRIIFLSIDSSRFTDIQICLPLGLTSHEN